MKRFVKFVLFVVLAFVTTMPAWGQASTEGKEFWVALTLSAAPSSGLPSPFIAVSTKEETTITITNPNDATWPGITRTVGANEWAVFDDIPLAQWYPTEANNIANIALQAGKTHNNGLKVVTDQDVSVFAALWMTNSFDAANVLPITVLQSEYYTQDYPPYIKPSDGQALAMFTILATENNTRVRITPSTTTQDGHEAGRPYTVTLNAGQTYYVISQTLKTLSGTHVEALEERKIAVFQGDVFTQIPGGKSARDCTYEQAMPVDYWGTQFVVTRSKEKDANRVRATAYNDGTVVYINNKRAKMLNAGETLEFEMRKNPMTVEGINPADIDVLEDAVYVNATCPIAVYSYDVSNGYTSSPSEMDASRGDPSMVWIAPLEQRIKHITFGVCGTSKTDKHYIDIVCQTISRENTTITPAPAEAISWTEVPGAPEWSYARVHLSTAGKTGGGNRVFTLQNDDGCIAHVYGNGNDESYAYSVGSAAVSLGSIVVKDHVFEDGGFFDKGFCVNDVLTFDASAGSTVIDKVEWNFGDGKVETVREASVKHEYPVKGWYDVTAKLYAHKDCPDTVYPPFNVNFSFYVKEPLTIQKKPTKLCMPEDYDGPMDSIGRITYDCDSIVITPYFFGKESSYQYNDTARDVAIINGEEYTSSQDVTWTTKNEWECDHHITCHLVVVKCLDMQINNNPELQHTCMGEVFALPVSLDKDGLAGDAYLVRWGDGQRTELSLAGMIVDGTRLVGDITLPIEEWPAGKYSAQVMVRDSNCHYDAYSPELNITVDYPKDVFARKFNNVLAVYAPGNGGNIGYDFRYFQWYRNGEAILGANSAVYYSETPFQVGESYYVELTDAQGLTLPSCKMIIDEKDIEDYTGGSSNAPKAEKRLVNQQLRIVIDDREYDMYGQRVE